MDFSAKVKYISDTLFQTAALTIAWLILPLVFFSFNGPVTIPYSPQQVNPVSEMVMILFALILILCQGKFFTFEKMIAFGIGMSVLTVCVYCRMPFEQVAVGAGLLVLMFLPFDLLYADEKSSPMPEPVRRFFDRLDKKLQAKFDAKPFQPIPKRKMIFDLLILGSIGTLFTTGMLIFMLFGTENYAPQHGGLFMALSSAVTIAFGFFVVVCIGGPIYLVILLLRESEEIYTAREQKRVERLEKARLERIAKRASAHHDS